MDGFEQANSRCCDAVSYYPLQLTSRNEVIRTAQLAESPACFYPVMVERGIVRTEAGQTRRIRIEAWDDCGNRSQLEFDILGRTESFRAEADSAATALTPERTGIVRLGREVTARIPPERSTNRFSAARNAAPPRPRIRRSSSSRPATASSRPPRRCTGR